jgi:integrase
MHASGTAYGAWDLSTWMAVAQTAGEHAASTLAVGCWLGIFTSQQALAAGVQPLHFARRLFGRAAVEHQVGRVQQYLHTVGYGPTSADHPCFVTALATLMLRVGRVELEAMTIDAIEAAHRAAPPRSPRRSAYFRLARALHGMGLLPRRIAAHAYIHDAATGVDPEWAAWCARWRATTTLTPRTAQGVYYGVLRAGRWLAREQPTVRSPTAWTRDLALAYVAAVTEGWLGELAAPSVYAGPRRRRNAPLSPRYKETVLRSLRLFFRDLQEWGWCPRHFDPLRVLATPRSLRALIAPNPRVLADDLWAKLLWAGIHLDQQDLPKTGRLKRPDHARPMYPFALVRALALTWLFAGLRSDELVRLRVGCIRWQQGAASPAAAARHVPGDDAACLLDVPTHKTGTAYTKPVDPLVGEAIAAWESARPRQPKLVDRKTGEVVALLFCFRGQPVPAAYFNRALIPLLCAKAGVPLEDARGRITSHRARATIATQLLNAKEPMTLFELQAWLGHSSPLSTQHYAKLTPTTLAKAYHDAGYFARNVRTIEVLIDREAVQQGSPTTGEPWQYFDLAHGYCTYTFFEQCPHRLACARCDFYVPKGSSKAQLLEAKANLARMRAEIPLTDDERAAVEDGSAAVERLLARLADTPTPAGPTPREIAASHSFVPLSVLHPSVPATVNHQQENP